MTAPGQVVSSNKRFDQTSGNTSLKDALHKHSGLLASFVISQGEDVILTIHMVQLECLALTHTRKIPSQHPCHPLPTRPGPWTPRN